MADGGAELREINHFFGTAFPVLDYRSLNGFLLGELGRVPEVGEHLDHGDVRIHVLAATDTQVTRARIRRSLAASGVGQAEIPVDHGVAEQERDGGPQREEGPGTGPASPCGGTWARR